MIYYQFFKFLLESAMHKVSQKSDEIVFVLEIRNCRALAVGYDNNKNLEISIVILNLT